MTSYPGRSTTAYDFQLEVCELSPSKRGDLVIDLRKFVVEINIYESLSKPYLTGNVVVSDTIGLYPHLDIKGIDRIKIGVKLPDEDADVIERTFYIDHVVNSTRTNDNEIVYIFHIVEEIAYLSSFTLVNDYFEGGSSGVGNGTQILQDLFRNYFSRNISTSGDGADPRSRSPRRYVEATPQIRYIAPNITPLAVAEAIRSRMVDERSTPYYLYSSLAGENIYLQSFMDLLVHNSRYNRPFKFSQANGQGDRGSLSIEAQQYNIESYSDTATLDMSNLNNMGFVNSMFYFYDVTRAQPFNPHHNDPTITNGAIVPSGPGNHWTAYGMFNSSDIISIEGGEVQFTGADEAVRYLYPENAVLPWETPSGKTNPQFNTGDLTTALSTSDARNTVEAVHKRPASKQIINMIASAGFRDGFYSYNESPQQSDYLKLVDAHALRAWITSDPIEFVVPGRVFLSRPVGDRPYQTSIGRIADLQFTTIEGNSIIPDLKRSGNHLLYAARHMFSVAEGYKVQFTGVKINPVEDTSVSSDLASVVPFIGPQ